MKSNYMNHHRQSSINQYNDSPPNSQGDHDITSLVEKKLGSIESYFQSFEERLEKVESVTRKTHKNTNYEKSDVKHFTEYVLKQIHEELSGQKNEYYQKFTAMEQRISDLSLAVEKVPTLAKVEKGLREQHLAVENLQEKILQIQESLDREQKSKLKFGPEMIESIKQSMGLELRNLSNIVQNIQESQTHLEREINSLKKIRNNVTIGAENQHGKVQYTKHQAQSPVKKNFEDEFVESSEGEEAEGRASVNKPNRQLYPQASPSSPNRRRPDYGIHYEDLGESSKIGVKRASSINKAVDSKNSYEQTSYSDYSRKKYEVLSSKNSTPPRKERRSELSSDLPKHENKNKLRDYHDRASKESTAIGQEGKPKKSYPDHRNYTDPSTGLLELKKNDQKEPSLSSTWLDYDKKRDQIETKEAAIQKNKEKIKEDIENLKKLVKRDQEKRVAPAERSRKAEGSLEKNEHKPLITTPQDAIAIRDGLYESNHSTPNKNTEIYRKEVRRSSSGISQKENDEYATFRYEDMGKAGETKHLRDTNNLADKARTRSTSLHDAKQQIDQLAQERRDNRLPEDKKKQIDEEIERRIREETEKRKRTNYFRGSGSQYLDHEKIQIKDEAGVRFRDETASRPRVDHKKTQSFKK